MDHNQLKEKLTGFYDGELTPEERSAVSAHLGECSSCQAEVNQWKKLSATFFQTNPRRPSEAFVQKVMTRINSSPSANSQELKPWSFLMSRWAFPATVGLALAGFLFLTLMPVEERITSTDVLELSTVATNIPSELLSSQPTESHETLRYIVGDL
jgi:anti-sigma factor RsiW